MVHHQKKIWCRTFSVFLELTDFILSGKMIWEVVMAKKKLYHGEGSIYQRADGMWVAKYRINTDSKPKYLYSTTEKGARQKLRDLKNTPEVVTVTSPQKATLADYVSHWLQTYKKPTIKPQTYDRLDSAARNQLYPNVVIPFSKPFQSKPQHGSDAASAVRQKHGD